MRVEITKTVPIFRHPLDHGTFLQWVVHEPPSAEISFKLERSGSPNGPWDELILKLDSYHFFDKMRKVVLPSPGDIVDDLNYLSLARTIYYRVIASTANGETAYDISDIGASLPFREQLLKRKMQRDLAIGFKFNGVDVAVLKRKHWGLRCPACYDRITRKTTNSKCAICFHTGFVNGYFTPVRIKMRFLAPNNNTSLSPQGKVDTTQVRAICGQEPAVDVDDIIVEMGLNKRYIVTAQSETQLRRETVHQSIILSELARDSVEYRIPANWDHIPIMY